MDDMFRVQPELISENVSKHKDSKPMTNYDVFTVIHTLIGRLNDINNVVLAIEGFEVKTSKTLLTIDDQNSVTVIRYINIINTIIGAIREKVKNVEKRLSLNYNQND